MSKYVNSKIDHIIVVSKIQLRCAKCPGKAKIKCKKCKMDSIIMISVISCKIIVSTLLYSLLFCICYARIIKFEKLSLFYLTEPLEIINDLQTLNV